MSSSNLYGMAAEFDSPDALLAAARAVRKRGYSNFEAYSPYPIKELDDVVPAKDRVPMLVLGGGITGLLTAWVLQYYSAVYSYPLNIGGRPLNSWPAFVPIMFELTVLFASFGAFFGTLWLCGLPKVNFPIFNLPNFEGVSKNRFLLCIEAQDPNFSERFTRSDLEELNPVNLWPVDKE